MPTNANSHILASILGDARKGTFTSLIQRKQGAERGRGPNRKRFGDDLVHTVFITGFDYHNLIRRSLAALPSDAELADFLADAKTQGTRGWAGRGKSAGRRTLIAADFHAARNELKASYERTLDPAAGSAATTKHVFDPLKIGDETVRGCRVYQCTADADTADILSEDDSTRRAGCQCRNCTGNAKAPLPGTIYLQGLKIWSKVLEPAPNGPLPASKSSTKTVAKKLIQKTLPNYWYVSYRLEPGTDFLLKAGGTAEVQATEAGFQATAELLAVLDKVA